MLELSEIGFKREGWVLRNVNFKLNKGDIFGIIGKSGVGKTTLLKIMSGLLDAEEGVVKLNGLELKGPARKLIPGYDSIQLVNQDFELEPYHTVEQNVKEKVLSLHTHEQVTIIDQLLELVELNGIKDRKAHLLSGGEQQRLAFARALACNPQVLLLDEPFVHMDQRLRWKVSDYLIQLNEQQGTAIVIVSHDGSEMMGFAKQIISIENEGVLRVDNTEKIYYHPINKQEGELMGMLNSIQFNGKEILFRPNEYKLNDEDSIPVEFKRGIDTGLVYYNYFLLEDKQQIMLTSSNRMNEVKSISISKR